MVIFQPVLISCPPCQPAAVPHPVPDPFLAVLHRVFVISVLFRIAVVFLLQGVLFRFCPGRPPLPPNITPVTLQGLQRRFRKLSACYPMFSPLPC